MTVNGAALFESSCARCHGADGSGRSSVNIQGVSVGVTTQAIRTGPGSMPAFPNLSDAEVLAIAQHVGTL